MADTTASPSKRVKPLSEDTNEAGAASSSSAFHALLVSEPSLVETIVGFIPVDIPVAKETDEQADDEGETTTTSSVDPAVTTVVALCRAFPSLAAHIGPANEQLWRAMVLQRFDFTVDPNRIFNVEDYDDEWRGRGPDYRDSEDQDDEEEDEEEEDEEEKQAKAERATTPVHPIRAAIRQWMRLHPDVNDPEMLEHDLAFWPKIGAFFRPFEYQFLTDIQSGAAPLTAWPEREDAFTLYCDLALLQHKLATIEDLQTWSDGEQEVTPCLLSRMDAEEITEENGFELFKHCDFIPSYWDGAIHDRWSGLDAPLPPPIPFDGNTQYEFDLRTSEEKAVFPLTPYSRQRFEQLRRVVHASFRDWRRLHVNSGEYPSVEFYIGQRKQSRRWLGFVGHSDYCGRPPWYSGDD